MNKRYREINLDTDGIEPYIEFFKIINNAECYLDRIERRNKDLYEKIQLESYSVEYEEIDEDIFDCLYVKDTRIIKHLLDNYEVEKVVSSIDISLKFLRSSQLGFWKRLFSGKPWGVSREDYLLYINYFVLFAGRTPVVSRGDALEELTYLETQFKLERRSSRVLNFNYRNLNKELVFPLIRIGDVELLNEEEVYRDLRKKIAGEEHKGKEGERVEEGNSAEKETNAQIKKNVIEGTYSIYYHLASIATTNGKDTLELLKELKKSIARTRITELKLTNLDLMYVSVIIGWMGECGRFEKIISEQEVAELFAIMKWCSKNNRSLLENSEKYRSMISHKGNRVMIESVQDTNEKLRVSLKTIGSDIQFYNSMLPKMLLLPSYKHVLAMLYGILRGIKDPNAYRSTLKLFKSEEMRSIVQVVYERFTTISISERFMMEVDLDELIPSVETFILMMAIDYSVEEAGIELEVLPETGYSLDELKEINKGYRTRLKDLRISSYKEIDKSTEKESGGGDNRDDSMEDVEVVTPLDLGLTFKQKKEVLSLSRFLLVKSKDVKLGKISGAIDVRDITTVTSDMMNNDYDAIVILTKGISHADSYRIKSIAGDTPIIYTSRTNIKLIVEDIYTQF